MPTTTRGWPTDGYIGRFAPSPSGPLHAGSLVSALAGFLDARAHGGRWLLRIEDIDTPRTVAGADRIICAQLQALGLRWDAPIVWQSQRHLLYEQAFARLTAAGRVYGCRCTRDELPPGPYPGTCRPHEDEGRMANSSMPSSPRSAAPDEPGVGRRRIRAWRFRVEPGVERFTDRWLGAQAQDVEHEVGDFIIRRADGLWAYQLAVVVDDADQGVTDIVRGTDLLDSTARQRQLARALGLPAARVLHVPLLCDAAGRKLSKQNHAAALDTDEPLYCLRQAWQALGFDALRADRPDVFLAEATRSWRARFGTTADTGPNAPRAPE